MRGDHFAPVGRELGLEEYSSFSSGCLSMRARVVRERRFARGFGKLWVYCLKAKSRFELALFSWTLEMGTIPLEVSNDGRTVNPAKKRNRYAGFSPKDSMSARSLWRPTARLFLINAFLPRKVTR